MKKTILTIGIILALVLASCTPIQAPPPPELISSGAFPSGDEVLLMGIMDSFESLESWQLEAPDVFAVLLAPSISFEQPIVASNDNSSMYNRGLGGNYEEGGVLFFDEKLQSSTLESCSNVVVYGTLVPGAENRLDTLISTEEVPGLEVVLCDGNLAYLFEAISRKEVEKSSGVNDIFPEQITDVLLEGEDVDSKRLLSLIYTGSTEDLVNVLQFKQIASHTRPTK